MNIEAGSFFWNELERAYDAWIDAWKALWFDEAYKSWLKDMDEAHIKAITEDNREILENLRQEYNKQ
jgi:hypothetical protein